MLLPLIVAVCLVAIGLAFALTSTPLCLNNCWLEQMLDRVLPDAYEGWSAGLPWWVIGAALALHTLAVRRA